MNRESWTDHLLRIVGEPGVSTARAAAQLLTLFAVGSRAAALEAIVTDRSLDPWVRIYVLRAFDERGLAMSDPAFESIVDEFVTELTTIDWRHRFANVEAISSLGAIASSPRQQASALRLIARLPVIALEPLLSWDNHACARLDATMHQLLRERLIAIGHQMDDPPVREPHATEPTDFAAWSAWRVDRQLRHPRPGEDARPLLEWAMRSASPSHHHGAIMGLVALDGGLDDAVIARFARCGQPLIELAVLGAVAMRGDPHAVTALEHASVHAPHVVLRAQALRSLVLAAPRPVSLTATCIRALAHDHAPYRDYAPVTCEAAIGLARHAEVSSEAALPALVEAALQLRNDDAWWSIKEALQSWLEGGEARINCVWYSLYLGAMPAGP